MQTIKFLVTSATLVLVLVLSLLLVLLNSQIVELDLFGLVLFSQSLGFMLLGAFVLGIVFSLALVFLPSQILVWRNKRLQKKIGS